MGSSLATKILKVSAWSLALVNFWVFSRFTVDDAYITWRYGRNLIENGVWNYNPTTFDPTQSYTNPIFALVSIIPASLGINVVLFFKILTLAATVAFLIYFLRRRPEANLPLALFFALPATVIHIFSGLETFLFVSLVFLLFLAIKNSDVKLAVVATLFLLITRPESILFLGLVPVFLSVEFVHGKIKIQWKRLLLVATILFTFAATLFVANIWLFGEALPNSVFVKSGQFFVSGTFLLWLLWLLPLIPVVLLKQFKLALFALAFYLPVALNYSTSNLTMNYASRFAFQIYAPIALLAIYVIANKTNQQKLASLFAAWKLPKAFAGLLTPIVALGFAVPSLDPANLDLITYSHRLQAAHGDLGRVAGKLHAEGVVQATAITDAGIFAFESRLPNLDFNKLGTHKGAVNGITRELVESYEVDFAVIRERYFVDSILRPYVAAKGMVHVCDAFFAPTYPMEIWAPTSDPRIIKICEQSVVASNSLNNYSNLAQAPWVEWK